MAVPVVVITLLFVANGVDPGTTGTVAILLLWSGVCAFLIPLLSRRGSKRPPRLSDPSTYAAELREVTRSRREIVQAFEIERRRIERDLHDGTQQYIVAASMQVGEAGLILEQVRLALAATNVPDEVHDQLGQVANLLASAQDRTDDALTELRRTVAGIHPKVLSDMGLEAAVRDIASRSNLDVTVRVPHSLPILPEGVVASAYFLVSEALTNIAKYASDAKVTVLLAADRDLHVSILDDGPGGARFRQGHGLAGMRERLRAFGGNLELSSPPGGPTLVATHIPLLLMEGEPSVQIDWEQEQ